MEAQTECGGCLEHARERGKMLVGISGKKRVGKDTFYQLSKSHLEHKVPGIKVRKYSFADAVKQYAVTYFKTNPEDKEVTRYILQGIGQMMRDVVRKDYWIEKVLNLYELDVLVGGVDVGFVTDVRYTNEADIFHDDDLLVRVTAPILHSDPHPSETALDNYHFEYMINNDGTLEEYKRKVEEWTDKMILPRLMK